MGRDKGDKRSRRPPRNSDPEDPNDDAGSSQSQSEVPYWGPDDSNSEASDNGIASMTTEDIESAESSALEKLAESRASTRMEGYAMLLKLISHSVSHDFLQSRRDELEVILKSSLKRGAELECMKAINSIEVIAVTLGVHGESLYSSLVPLLHRIAKNHASVAAREASLLCLAVISFVTCHDIGEALTALKYFTKFVYLKEHRVAAAAINAWSLVVSSLPVPTVRSTVRKAYLRSLMRLLSSSSTNVRISAGMAIALVNDSFINKDGDESCDDGQTGDTADDEAKSEDNDDNYDSANEEDDTDAAGNNENDSSLDSEDEVDVEDLPQVLELISKDSSKARGRKERLQLRSAFRDIVASVSEGSPPSVSMKLGNDVVKFDRWCEMIQLAAFRRVLRGGLQKHLVDNELLQSVLSLPPNLTLSGMTDCRNKAQLAEEKEFRKNRAVSKKDARKKKNSFKYSE